MHSNSQSDHLATVALLFMELGVVILVMSVLARLALRMGLTPIPLYLVAGLCVGHGGFHSLKLSESFIGTGSEIGVILLLFMLGLEYSGGEMANGLKRGWRAGLLDGALNFVPGFILGLAVGMKPVGALLLGGVTWISSSSITAKVLSDLNRLGNRETGSVLSILVLEDLAMALYLPLMAVLLLGQTFWVGLLSTSIAVMSVLVVLFLAIKHGEKLSKFVSHESDEVVLLSIFGTVLLVAGVAQQIQVSAAVGAFLVGLALSGAVADKAHHLISPLRDLFAVTFFFFQGMQINPAALPAAMPLALALAVVTTVTKVFTGWQAAKWEGVAARGRMRAGTALVARGEFSIVIAGLGTALEPKLAPLAAAYVLLLAIAGPVLTRYAENLSDLLDRWLHRGEPDLATSDA